MKLSIIAAIGQNNELGINNQLIWHLKKDMKFFKETTINHKIVMGRKTFESLPKLLVNREHIILTKQNINLPNVKIFHDISSFLKAYENLDEEIFNIGGQSIYKELLEYADKLYLTEIEATSKADAYFPIFDKNDFEKEILSDAEEDGIKYKHVLYKRRIGR